jgi:hypothetical protein
MPKTEELVTYRCPTCGDWNDIRMPAHYTVHEASCGGPLGRGHRPVKRTIVADPEAK